jgi:hypothetical protein
MVGAEGCWAVRDSGANRISESRMDGRLLGMNIFLLKTCVVGRRRGEMRCKAADSEEDQIRRAMRGGNRGGA